MSTPDGNDELHKDELFSEISFISLNNLRKFVVESQILHLKYSLLRSSDCSTNVADPLPPFGTLAYHLLP